jgi:hypothetical protein
VQSNLSSEYDHNAAVSDRVSEDKGLNKTELFVRGAAKPRLLQKSFGFYLIHVSWSILPNG